MRVLRVIGGLDPAFGGPPRSTLNSCIAAHRAGVQTTVMIPAPAAGAPWLDDAVARLGTEGIPTRIYPLLARPARQSVRWALSPALLRSLDREIAACDIVHVHAPWHLTALGGTIAGAIRRRPVVMTPHESLTTFDRRSPRDATYLPKRIGHWLYGRLLTLTICASELERRDTIGTIPASRTIAIPHPVRDERLPPPAPHTSLPRALRIGFLGRFHPKKNIESLIRALPRLPESVTLDVAGSGPPAYERALYALAATEHVTQRIRLQGFIDDTQKPAFFANVDLLAMPSRYECFGLSAAEALSFGVPVLVTPETGVAETLRRRGGGLVVANQVPAIAAAIARLWDRPEDLHLLREHTADAADEFTFARHGEALRAAYETLTTPRDRRPTR